MKKKLSLALALLMALFLASCAPQDAVEPPDWSTPTQTPEASTAPSEAPENAITKMFTIVDGAEDGVLVLAGDNVYTLSVGDIPVTLDGEPVDASVLEDGMHVEIVYDAVLETWPGQLADVSSINAYSVGSEKEPGGGYYDLCGLYLQVLEDLWEKDEGLNSDIRYISVDLSEAPGELTDAEKAAIAWVFASKHDAKSLTLTYAELKDGGYLADDGSSIGYWEDGVLFSISAADGHESEIYSLPVMHFDAQKWRSGLGAYFLIDCTATWPEAGTWTGYSVSSEAIS